MEHEAFGYQWVRKSTGEFYRGVHLGCPDDNYAGSGSLFIKKYGGRNKTTCKNPEDWVRSILFLGSYDECLLWESLVVTEREVNNPECLNLVVGGVAGTKGRVLSEETKKKISEGNKGKVISDEHRKAIALANSRRVITQETRDKLSKENSGENNNFYGRKHTEETKRKLSELTKKQMRRRVKQEACENE